MRVFQLFICLAVLTFSNGWAQMGELVFDYSVTYKVPSPRKSTIDTVRIGFSKDGRFLFTDSQAIADGFQMNVARGLGIPGNTESILLYDAKKASMHIGIEAQGLTMYMEMSLAGFTGGTTPLNVVEESRKILNEKTGQTEEFLGTQLDVYHVFPDDKPDDPLTMLVDSSKDMDNSALFKEFIAVMLANSNSTGSLGVELPRGLILSVAEPDGTVLIEAIEVDDDPTKIDLTYSFKIQE